MNNQVICKLIDHKVIFHDGPYPVCDRCGSHGYYNKEEWEWGWNYWPNRLYWWLKSLPGRYKIWRINNRSLPDDEIPF